MTLLVFVIISFVACLVIGSFLLGINLAVRVTRKEEKAVEKDRDNWRRQALEEDAENNRLRHQLQRMERKVRNAMNRNHHGKHHRRPQERK